MAAREEPQVARAVVTVLHQRHGGTQLAFAHDSGVSRDTISKCENAQRSVTRTTLNKLATAAEVTQEELDELLAVARRIFGGEAAESAQAHAVRDRWAGPSGLARALEAFIEKRARALRHGHRDLDPGSDLSAASLWARLAQYTVAQRQDLVEEVEAFQSWDLAYLLCERSLSLALKDASEAVEVATLAVQVATLAPGSGEQKANREAYAWAHLGNALKVQNDLRGADQAFLMVHRLWAEVAEPLGEAQVLSFEAALRALHRQFTEALDLADRALSVDKGEWRAHLLVSKAKILSDKGDFENSLALLRQTEPFLESAQERRLLLTAHSNTAYLLSVLGQHQEAAALLPGVWRHADELFGALDRLRLTWVTARVDAGTGHMDQGIAALVRVREEFASREMSYDWALVTLELAVLHLERGDTARTKQLAREMLPVFRANGIHREALAALTLFCRAAEQERATAELGWRVARFLHSARNNPELRFEAGGS